MFAFGDNMSPQAYLPMLTLKASLYKVSGTVFSSTGTVDKKELCLCNLSELSFH